MVIVINPDVAAQVSAVGTAVYAVISAVSLWRLGNRDVGDVEVRETISRYLEFFERVEHLRAAGVLPAAVLRRAFGPALVSHLADPRFDQVIQHDAQQYEEVLLLAKRIGNR